jgi:hypothetical protein
VEVDGQIEPLSSQPPDQGDLGCEAVQASGALGYDDVVEVRVALDDGRPARFDEIRDARAREALPQRP